MEQAGPEPRPGKPDRASQRRPQRWQGRVARDAQDRPGKPERDPLVQRPDWPASAAGSRDPARPELPPEVQPEVHRAAQPAAQPGTHPVVVGYDGSAASRHALAYGAGFARRLGQPLLVVYVVPFGVYCEPMTGQVVYPARDRAELEPWLFAELDEACDWEGLEVSVMTRRGNAARELAAAADSTSADALIVGAPGSWLHHLSGSTPGWLARHARCPVIVVP
jgi:nucleotide-binding universal stress UspA family protein